MVHSEASEIEGARRERRIEGTSWFLAVSTKPPEGLPEMGLGILMGNVLFMAFFGAVTWLTYGSSPEFVGENTGSSSLFRDKPWKNRGTEKRNPYFRQNSWVKIRVPLLCSAVFPGFVAVPGAVQCGAHKASACLYR